MTRRSTWIGCALAIASTACGCALARPTAGTADRTATSTAPSATASTISTPSASPAPTDQARRIKEFAGKGRDWVVDSNWMNGNWYVAVQHSTNGTDLKSRVLRSVDGIRWVDMTPTGYTTTFVNAPGNLKLLTSTPGHVYLVGNVDFGQRIHIWDIDAAKPEPVAEITPEADALEASFATAAGCPTVAALEYPPGAVKDGWHDIFAGHEPTDVATWMVCDSHVAAYRQVKLNPADDTSPDAVGLVEQGGELRLILSGHLYGIRNNGWVRLGTTAPEVVNLLVSNRRTFVTSDYKADGTDLKLPTGRLPDLGVTAADRQEVGSGCASDAGFVLAGHTEVTEQHWVAAIWLSIDGFAWRKVPVKANGLQLYENFIGAVCADGGQFLLIAEQTEEPGDRQVLTAWTAEMANL